MHKEGSFYRIHKLNKSRSANLLKKSSFEQLFYVTQHINPGENSLIVNAKMEDTRYPFPLFDIMISEKLKGCKMLKAIPSIALEIQCTAIKIKLEILCIGWASKIGIEYIIHKNELLAKGGPS